MGLSGGVETGNGWLSVLEFWSYGEASINAASAQSMTTGHWSRSLKSTAARDEHCPYWDLKPRFGFFDEHSVYYTVQKCEKFGNVTKFNSSFLTFGADYNDSGDNLVKYTLEVIGNLELRRVGWNGGEKGIWFRQACSSHHQIIIIWQTQPIYNYRHDICH